MVEKKRVSYGFAGAAEIGWTMALVDLVDGV